MDGTATLDTERADARARDPEERSEEPTALVERRPRASAAAFIQGSPRILGLAASCWSGAGLVRAAREVVAADDLVVRTTTGLLAGEDGGRPLRLCFVGRERYHKDFLFLFGGKDGRKVVEQRTHEVGGLVGLAWHRDVVAREIEGADVVVKEAFLDGPLSYGALDTELSFFPYLRATLEVAPTVQEQIARIRSKGHAQKLRKALKGPFTSRSSTDERDFELFYETMYLPHARRRFGALACVEPKERLLGMFRRGGDLVVVERDGQPVAAALNHYPLLQPGTLVYLRNGMADSGALSPAELGDRNAALEVAVWQHAARTGMKLVDYDLTGPVLTDGVSTHKRRVGCDLSPGPYSPRFHLRIAPQARASVLARFPLVGQRAGRFEAGVGFRPEMTAFEDGQLLPYLRGLLFPSLARLRVYAEDLSDGQRAALARALDEIARAEGKDVVADGL